MASRCRGAVEDCPTLRRRETLTHAICHRDAAASKTSLSQEKKYHVTPPMRCLEERGGCQGLERGWEVSVYWGTESPFEKMRKLWRWMEMAVADKVNVLNCH